MKTGIVFRWPAMSSALVEGGKRGGTLESSAGPELPGEWRGEASEARVLVEEGVFYRFVEVPSRGDPAEAALFMLEPTLPLPLEELIASFVVVRKERKKKHLLVALIPRKTLEKVRTDVQAAIGPGGPRISWISAVPLAFLPSGAGAYRGRMWAGIAESGKWIDLQSAASGALASTAIEKRRDLSSVEWRDVDPEAEVLAAMAAGPKVAWSTEKSASAGSRLRHWPVVLIILSVALGAAAFGLRVHAANERLQVANRAVEAAFKAAFPKTKLVSPAEQIRSQRREAREKFEILSARFAKSESALRVLAAIEKSTNPGDLVIDDLRAGPREIAVIGSARDAAVVQSLASGLKAELELENDLDARYRQSPAGLGWDFTVEGAR